MGALHQLKKKIDSRFIALQTARFLFRESGSVMSRCPDTNSLRSTLFVVLSSDKSNCTELHTNILSVSKGILSSFEKAESDTSSYSFFCLGSKISRSLRVQYRTSIRKTFKNLHKEAPSMFIAYIIASNVVSSGFDIYEIIFTRYLTSAVMPVSTYRICSYSLFFSYMCKMRFSGSEAWAALYRKARRNSSFLYELYYFNLCLLFVDILSDIEYCELALRIRTMDVICKNVSIVITRLNDEYNKYRQCEITNQILELLNTTASLPREVVTSR